MSVNIAVCQFIAGLDINANIKNCLQLIDEAAAAGAKLAVLPEAVMFFDPAKEQEGQHGEAVDGPFVTAIAAGAKKAGIAVLVGMSEKIDDEHRDSNTVVAISAAGELIGSYRKIHLYDAFGYRESDTIKPGDIGDPLVFDVDGVTVGVLTCYDLRFPEAFRWVVDAGAQVVAVPAAWAAGPMKEAHWRTMLASRAIENTVYVAAAGQTGPVSCGQSLIIDPMGTVRAGAGDKPGIAVGVVDPELLAAVREVNPSLGNRRFSVVADRS